ncbi:MAG: DUF4430 domain-containing protein [Patescibacteria group bacterium]|jgi:hypothetical protein
MKPTFKNGLKTLFIAVFFISLFFFFKSIEKNPLQSDHQLNSPNKETAEISKNAPSIEESKEADSLDIKDSDPLASALQPDFAANSQPDKDVLIKTPDKTGTKAGQVMGDVVEGIIKKTDEAPDADEQKISEEKNISINIYVEDKKYEAELAEGNNVYALMDKLRTQNALNFKAKEYSGMGYFIEEINGLKNSPLKGMFWIYYINNAPAKAGISNYFPKAGDVIAWKYEESNF